ncbi:MAG: hypothetical protein WC700_07705 [Gemmatimonadaceae bacterium]|jgi:hypothetical protein
MCARAFSTLAVPVTMLVTVLAVLVLIVLALVLAARRRRGVVGGAPPRGEHVVVDTLNLAHWLQGPQSGQPRLTAEAIVDAVDRTAPALKLRWPGRVMYVLKDRETALNDEGVRARLAEAAKRNGVYIIVAERYADPPSSAAAPAEHSSRGRDDFLMALLAHQWRCPVLTDDRLRDFDRFRATVSPFQYYEFAFWRELPAREFVRPDSPAHARLRRPRTLRYDSAGLQRSTDGEPKKS